MKYPVIPYNPKLKARARQLRQNMTLAEVLLWNRLKGMQLLGLDFERQRPVDHYIVDFYCKKLMLAIEVDGRSHDYKEKQDLDGVVKRIEKWVKEHGCELNE